MTDDLDLELKKLVQASLSVETPLPDAGIIWWKAEIYRRRQLQQEALKPVLRAQRVALAVLCVLVLAAMFFLCSAESTASLLGQSSLWPALLAVAIGFVAFSLWSYRIASADS
jgi:drug/metabolite transporter (DMT)-like permease